MDNDSKQKSGPKKIIDILTLAGLGIALLLMVFGVVLNEGVSEPDRNDYVSFSFDPETGDLSSEPDFDEEAYNTAMTAYLAAERAGIGIFNFSLLSAFVHVPSLAITVGGTFAAMMIATPLSIFGKFFTYLRIAFMPNQYDPNSNIEEIVALAIEARSKGILSLENSLQEFPDSFLKSSFMLIVDGVSSEDLQGQLEASLDKLDARHAVGKSFMELGSAFAPGFGLIGTLIGLVNMLGSLDDPNAIGPAMAVALLTTLYGSMLANIFFSPIANKLSVRHDEEYFCCELVCVGVQAIQAGLNPKYIEEKMRMMLSNKENAVHAAKKQKQESNA